jgi:hypothetical protein
MQFSIAALVSVLAAAEVASAWQSMSNSHRDRKHPQTIHVPYPGGHFIPKLKRHERRHDVSTDILGNNGRLPLESHRFGHGASACRAASAFGR